MADRCQSIFFTNLKLLLKVFLIYLFFISFYLNFTVSFFSFLFFSFSFIFHFLENKNKFSFVSLLSYLFYLIIIFYCISFFLPPIFFFFFLFKNFVRAFRPITRRMVHILLYVYQYVIG